MRVKRKPTTEAVMKEQNMELVCDYHATTRIEKLIHLGRFGRIGLGPKNLNRLIYLLKKS